jgi:hypothetical protein
MMEISGPRSNTRELFWGMLHPLRKCSPIPKCFPTEVRAQDCTPHCQSRRDATSFSNVSESFHTISVEGGMGHKTQIIDSI